MVDFADCTAYFKVKCKSHRTFYSLILNVNSFKIIVLTEKEGGLLEKPLDKDR